MSVVSLASDLEHETTRRAYFLRLEILDRSASLIKARLYIAADLFVQVYRNDRFDTTNFALIYGERRIYARDQLGGQWHRHLLADPELHDLSPEARQSISLPEFLDEVEGVLSSLGLP
jgi:hypothetical protein